MYRRPRRARPSPEGSPGSRQRLAATPRGRLDSYSMLYPQASRAVTARADRNVVITRCPGPGVPRSSRADSRSSVGDGPEQVNASRRISEADRESAVSANDDRLNGCYRLVGVSSNHSS